MSLWQIFRWPLIIGLFTLTGLVTGLVSDSWGDVVAAAGLFVPAAVGTWYSLRRRPSPLQAAKPGAEAGNRGR